MAVPASRRCSLCGHDGHNSRTCTVEKMWGVKLFGVNLVSGNAASSPSPSPSAASPSSPSTMKKSASTGNLSGYGRPASQPELGSRRANQQDGYASDSLIHANIRARPRKKATPWTEEEHKLFLLALQELGKGDWKGISKQYVKTRTPTQVASHAQKYFMRQSSTNRRRRRSSLFDMKPDMVPSVLPPEESAKETPALEDPERQLDLEPSLGMPETQLCLGQKHLPTAGSTDGAGHSGRYDTAPCSESMKVPNKSYNLGSAVEGSACDRPVDMYPSTGYDPSFWQMVMVYPWYGTHQGFGNHGSQPLAPKILKPVPVIAVPMKTNEVLKISKLNLGRSCPVVESRSLNLSLGLSLGSTESAFHFVRSIHTAEIDRPGNMGSSIRAA